MNILEWIAFMALLGLCVINQVHIRRLERRVERLETEHDR